ncbi:site-specific integrase [Phyllobacterium sp. LjRoot231]|uniref:tyrosine-type recombinase/integrase n=1 Tax=Phyllobacterium sp. LjRoot231 TaxID=3342289 RepID=UPI003ED06113
MAHLNAFGFDLSDEAARATLPLRYPAYWQVTQYGRAIGYHHYALDRSFWVARLRQKNGNYRQRRVSAVKEGECEIGLNFDEALLKAEEWFSHKRNYLECIDPIPIGSREELIFCPAGQIFTLGHALRDYVEWKRIAAARSHFLTLISLINFHLVPRVASIGAEQFNGELVRHFVRDVLETPPRYGNKPLKPKRPISEMTEDQLRKRKKTVNTLLGILRVAVQMAWENGKIDSDRVWRCIRRLPVVDRPRILHLTRSECHELLGHCGKHLYSIVLAALYTGCRVTELLRMTAGDMGRDGPRVYVTPVKCYRERFVFLPDEGMDFFRDLAAGKAASDLLFVNSRGRSFFNYKELFRKAVALAGLPKGFCFHSLRHTYASQLIADGAPLIVVSEQLGHSDCNTVIRTYGHLAPQLRQSEVNLRFASLLPSAATSACSHTPGPPTLTNGG